MGGGEREERKEGRGERRKGWKKTPESPLYISHWRVVYCPGYHKAAIV